MMRSSSRDATPLRLRAYLALAGATGELVRAKVYAGRTRTLPDLEDTVVSLHLAVLAGRPW